jgi:hypothetical protein
MIKKTFTTVVTIFTIMIICNVRIFGVDILWSGNGTDNYWNTAENWAASTTPTSVDCVVFTDTNSPGTSVMDMDYTVAGFQSWNKAETTDSVTHNIDLGGNTLQVDGMVGISYIYEPYRGPTYSDEITIQNGTFRVGSDAVLQDMYVGYYRIGNSAAKFTMGSGSIFDVHLDSLVIGSGYSSGTLNLTNALLFCGVETGVLRMKTLSLGLSGGKTYRDNEILFGSSLLSFEINEALNIAALGQELQAYIGKIGDNGTAFMPDNVDIKLGVDETSRAEVKVGMSRWDIDGHFVAGTGGILTAYISSLQVGTRSNPAVNTTVRGLMDFGNMSNCVFDVSGDTLVGQSDADNIIGHGTLRLPTGVARFNNLIISTNWGSGLLDLNGTDCTVVGNFYVGATGTNIVRSIKSGGSLSLGSSATLNVADGGKVRFVFDERDAEFGFEWRGGDYVDEVNAFITAGKFVIEGTQGNKVETFFSNDNTYIGFTSNFGTVIFVR